MLVQEGIHDKFVAAFQKAIEQQIKVADGFTPGATQGPMINKRAVEKVIECLKLHWIFKQLKKSKTTSEGVIISDILIHTFIYPYWSTLW